MTIAPPGGATHATPGTREQILAVARELFVTQGFAATTTREIAERLGVTKAALYYHFHTKDDLLEALLAPITQRMRVLAETTPLRPAASARRALLAAYLDLVADDLDLIRVLLQDPSANHRPATQKHEALSERVIQLLSGQAEPDAATRARARAALGALGAGLIHSAPDDDPEVVRVATLAAACGALGIPAPARTGPHSLSRKAPADHPTV